jgi:hypothetical protein
MAISRFKTSTVAQGLPKYQDFWDQISTSFPAIVTSGLQVFWDPANTASYPGSGTSVFNITPGGSTHTGTLQDGISFTSSGSASYFTGDGVNDDILNTSYSGATSGVGTLSVWLYPTSPINTGLNYYAAVGSPTGTGEARAIAANSSGWYFISNGSSPQDQLIASQTFNTWQQISIVFNGTSVKFYINTTEYSYTKTINTPSSSRIRIGEALWNNENAPARIGSVAVYNTALSSSDITTNFNALKGRYGL